MNLYKNSVISCDLNSEVFDKITKLQSFHVNFLLQHYKLIQAFGVSGTLLQNMFCMLIVMLHSMYLRYYCLIDLCDTISF